MYLDGEQWYFIEAVLDIPRKATLARVGETVVSRCFAGCLGQACNRCSNRCCCDLHIYTNDVRPIDALAGGVESPSQTLAPGVVFCTAFRQFPRNLARIPRHHRGCVDDGRSAAGVERCHHPSSAQEEGSDRVWHLQGPLSGGACWQGSPQNRIESTWRLLRGSWDSSRGTVRLPAPTLDNRYNVRRAQTSGTGVNKQYFTRDLLHRSGKSVRLCQSCYTI